jgi:hypothetical protein
MIDFLLTALGILGCIFAAAILIATGMVTLYFLHIGLWGLALVIILIGWPLEIAAIIKIGTDFF